MCQIHGQDKLSVLKHVLCNLMSVSEFFDMKMLNTLIIKKIEYSLQWTENVPPWVQFPSLAGTVLISGMYHK